MYFTYLARELRRRRKQASLVAVGLAVGVGLVVTVAAASSGVNAAQSQVLHSLYGVGTDLTVTNAPTFGSGGPFRFGSGAGAPATRPKTFSGQHVAATPGLTAISAQDITQISSMADVRGAAGGLSLSVFTFSGQVQAGSGFTPGSGSGSGSGAGASFSATSFSVQGVAINAPGLGPLSGASISSGHYFSSSDSNSDNALVDAAYAKQAGLKVGSHLTLSGTSYQVIGLVAPASGASGADVYLPLARAQAAAAAVGYVNTIYVDAASNSAIGQVQSEIHKAFPSATVTTAADLASQVSGSLGTASSLASSLGKWLAAIVLLVAFAVAAMLTLSSVSSRVREFGTLKALGWRSRRIVGQIIGEGLVIGVVGAAAGVGLGFLGALLVARLGGAVKATVGSTAAAHVVGPGGGFGGGGRPGFLRNLGAATHTVNLHLTAPVSLQVVGLAILLALAGGLLAGIIGGWRVARLRPAEALRRVE
ncbi:MAG: ABC transporter permease [Candidatus Dormibacteria bacterium]